LEANTKRLTVAGLLVLLVPLGGQVPALLLGVIVTTLLAALAVWEARVPARGLSNSGGGAWLRGSPS
jgi:hypothetical protein